jgi:hypothetical protein
MSEVQCFVVDAVDYARRNEPGAMWYAPDGSYKSRLGPDGRFLMVRLPNGDIWRVDSRASNCTRPDDDVHRCWVRHGEAPNITVDKNGDTCGCGHSIGSGWKDGAYTYHGFLTNGVLRSC